MFGVGAKYFELDGEMFWTIVEDIMAVTDVVTLFDANGKEIGILTTANIDDVAGILVDNGIISEDEYKLVAENYDVVVLMDKDKLFKLG